MVDGTNFHVGHRERMINKFLSNPDSVLEHELLEILLYDSIKRKDTNPLAHKLINTFGSIKGVFNASISELMSVDGVGIVTAKNLSLYGKIFNKISSEPNTKKQKMQFSFEKNKEEILELFNGVFVETAFFIMLDKFCNPIIKMDFSNFDKKEVSANLKDVANSIAINKPTYLIMCHNHPMGILEPSNSDDVTTAKIHLLCLSHGVTLLDHVIVCDKQAFSYHASGRLQKIKEEYSIDSSINNIDFKGVDKWIK